MEAGVCFPTLPALPVRGNERFKGRPPSRFAAKRSPRVREPRDGDRPDLSPRVADLMAEQLKVIADDSRTLAKQMQTILAMGTDYGTDGLFRLVLKRLQRCLGNDPLDVLGAVVCRCRRLTLPVQVGRKPIGRWQFIRKMRVRKTWANLNRVRCRPTTQFVTVESIVTPIALPEADRGSYTPRRWRVTLPSR